MPNKGTAYNRAYLASVLRTSAQIPRYARNFRYAQPLYEMRRSKTYLCILPVIIKSIYKRIKERIYYYE